MDPNAAITPETFNIVHLFLAADWVVKVVMIGLGLASLWSWAVIIVVTVGQLRAEVAGDAHCARSRIILCWR